MNNPDLLAYQSYKSPHYYISPEVGGAPPFTPYEEISYDHAGPNDTGIFVIADDNTLGKDFYVNAALDTRYYRDRTRLEGVRNILDLIEFERVTDPDTEAMLRRVARHFMDGLYEGDYLADAFEEAEMRKNDWTHEEIVAFFSAFDTDDIEYAQRMNARLYTSPGGVRVHAFEDLVHVHQNLLFIEDLKINNLSDDDLLMKFMRAKSASEDDAKFTGLLIDHEEAIDELIRQQKEIDERTIAAGGMRANQILENRSGFRRDPMDCVDGLVYAYAGNHGVIVDPKYLLHPRYEQMLEEPLQDKISSRQDLLHMIGGTYTYGHDHMFLYRNRFQNIPNAHTGTPPDYGAIRVGNFLFHDFKLVEYGPSRYTVELGLVMEYAISHYLEGYVLFTPEDIEKFPADEERIDLYLYNSDPQNRFAIPLQQDPKLVLPFRALKKDFESSQYFEYGTDCYLAELVDMATQIDLIMQKTGRSTATSNIGDITIGEHTTNLLSTVWQRTHNQEAVATMIDQIIHMNGAQAEDGRETINGYISAGNHLPQEKHGRLRLEGLPVVTRYEDGQASKSWPPLTCYHEWFKRYARPVSEEELRQRNIPIRPAARK